MKVKTIMNKKVPVILAHESIQSAINILTKVPESALPVVDKKGKVIGELSQRNLLLKIIGKDEVGTEDLNFSYIRNVMSSKSLDISKIYKRHQFTASPDDDAREIIKFMYDSEISTIPVVDEKGKLLGIISDICVLKQYKKIISDK